MLKSHIGTFYRLIRSYALPSEHGDELILVIPGLNESWKKVIGLSQLAARFNSADLEQFEGIGRYYDPQFEQLRSVGVTVVVFSASDR